MLNTLQKIKDTYAKITITLCTVICWIILIMNVLQVICRYALSVSFYFSEDVTVLGMLWIMALGISVGILFHDHLLINIIDGLVSKKALDILNFILDFVLALFGIAMVYFGNLSLQANKGFTQSMLGFDESFRYVPVLIGGILTFFASIECILEQICVWKSGKEEKE
ncbi:MAG: TRAP transporter small permease [Sphaerochaetaceae bacterium]|nr:TRAP transporter small permease [Sphaerochaetaceae bacterium]